MKLSFTDKDLAALKLPKGKVAIKIWDMSNLAPKGFGAVLGPEGLTFIVNIHRGNNKYTQEKLGTRAELSLPEARKLAKAAIGRVAENKLTPGDVMRLSTTGPTVKEAIESYIAQMEREKRRPQSISSVRRELLNGPHLRDWQDRPLRSIKPLEWRLRHEAIGTHGEATANRIMRNFSTVWSMIAKESMVMGIDWPRDGAALIRWYAIAPANDTIAWSDLPAWRATLDLISPMRRVFNLLLLFTGLRRTDGYTVRWEHLNLTAEFREARVGETVITLPPCSMFRPFPKGGGRKAFILPLPGYIVELLKEMHAERTAPPPSDVAPALLARWHRERNCDDRGWVFPTKADKTQECPTCAELGMPGHIKGEVTHLLSACHMSAERAKKLGVAKMPNPHMLRHLYTNANEEIEMPEGVAQKLVNHGPRTVTQKYRRQEFDLMRYWQELQCAFLLSRIRGERHLRAVA